MQVLRACIAIVSTPTKLVVYSTSWVKNDRKDEQCSQTAEERYQSSFVLPLAVFTVFALDHVSKVSTFVVDHLDQ